MRAAGLPLRLARVFHPDGVVLEGTSKCSGTASPAPPCSAPGGGLEPAGVLNRLRKAAYPENRAGRGRN